MHADRGEKKQSQDLLDLKGGGIMKNTNKVKVNLFEIKISIV